MHYDLLPALFTVSFLPEGVSHRAAETDFRSTPETLPMSRKTIAPTAISPGMRQR
jgi:hypothetical protein